MPDKNKLLLPVEKKLQKQLAVWFRKQGRMFLKLFKKLESEFQEADIRDWGRYWDFVSFMTVTGISADIDSAVVQSMILAGLLPPKELYKALAFTLKNPMAVQYLENYGALLVAEVGDTTKEYLNTIITNSVNEGRSYAETARAIKNRFEEFAVGMPQLHIRSRAELIAITETGNAYMEASLIQSQALQSAGLPMEKKWLTSRDDRVSDGCRENAEADWIPLDQPFPSGHQRPLRFPGCRCDMQTRWAREGR